MTYEGAGTSVRRFLVADFRGSIVARTDSSGVLVGKVNAYNEYGVSSGHPEGTPDAIGRFQYTGQIGLPSATGEAGALYHYKARTYAPGLGRFLQPDPIGYGDGVNIYAYAGIDPVNGRDPSGTQVDTIDVKASPLPPLSLPSSPIAPNTPSIIPTSPASFEYIGGGYYRDPNAGPGECPVYNLIAGCAGTVSWLSFDSSRAGAGSHNGFQLASSSSGSLPPFDLGPQFGDRGINAVGVPLSVGNGRGGLDHIDNRHGSGWSDTQAGRFFPQFTGAYNLSTKVLIPILSSPTSIVKPNTGGRPGFIVTGSLPYPIGQTGTFRGVPSAVTNRTMIVLAPVPILSTFGIYQV